MGLSVALGFIGSLKVGLLLGLSVALGLIGLLKVNLIGVICSIGVYWLVKGRSYWGYL